MLRTYTALSSLVASLVLTACPGAPGAPAAPAPVASAPAGPAQLPEPERDHREYLALAAEAYKRGDDAALLSYATKAAALAPDHPRVLYISAVAYIKNGDADAAVAALARLAQLRVFRDVATDPHFKDVDHPHLGAVRATMTALQRPIGAAKPAFELTEKAFIPEGIAVDPQTGAVFVGSVHQRKIVRRDTGGAVTVFAANLPGAPLGLAVDRPRGLLWACVAAVPQMRDYRAQDAGFTVLLGFRLDGGALARTVQLPASAGSGDAQRQLNDLAVAADGTVYATDAKTGAVYALAPGADQLTALVAAGALHSAQGIALAPGGDALYVADYGSGVVRVALPGGAVSEMKPPPDTTLLGIDGLVLRGDSLFAVQNGIEPHRVLRLSLTPDGQGIAATAISLMNHPRFAEPTLAAIAGDALLLVANSQWGSFDDGVIWPAERLHAPVILRLPL